MQWAKTGSTGLKGFHGRFGSLPWFAGISMSLGFVLVLSSPIVALIDGPGGALLFERAAWHVFGAVLFCAGTAATLLAQLSMGDSWRVGVDEAEKTRLVTTGLFAWVRNPIFSFMWLSLLGLALLIPNVTALLGGLLTIVGIELQVRVVEEPYLTSTHGERYFRYASTVGRFVPRIGRLTA